MRQLGMVLLAVTVAAGCGGRATGKAKRVRTFDQQWQAASIEKLDLSGINGKIVVEPSAGDVITMRARAEIGGGIPSKDDSKLIRIEQNGSTLVIRDEGGVDGDDSIFSFLDDEWAKVDFVMQVPARMQLELETVNGAISVHGVGSVLDASSVNGRIEARSPAEKIAAETVNGSVQIEYMTAFRGGEFSTVNGSIRLTVPPNSAIDADVDQLNGSFSSNVPVIIDGDEVRTDSSPGTTLYPLEVSTVNGSVSLTQRPI
jgi:hypothetical protein